MGRALPTACLTLAIEAMQLLLMWSLRGLEQSVAPEGAEVAELAKAVASFGGQLDAIGAAEDDEAVQQAIQKVQSNLFLVFSARKLKVRLQDCAVLQDPSLDAQDCSDPDMVCLEDARKLNWHGLFCHAESPLALSGLKGGR